LDPPTACGRVNAPRILRTSTIQGCVRVRLIA